MSIVEAINRYLELKPCKNWIESIEPSFFFEFAETVITAYEKEKEEHKWEDKINAKIEELDKEEKEALKGTKGQDRYEIKQEYMHKRSVLQSLLEKE